MNDERLELKVGALVALALLAALGILALMGELNFKGGESLTVDFAHAGSVVKGAPVKLGGVSVGRVDSVTLLPARRDDAGEPLLVTMKVSVSAEARATLREDLSVTVSSQGALGESYLELNPGNAAKPWPLGAAVRGLDAPRLDVVANRLARFLEAASKVLENDPDALVRLVGGISGLAKTVDGVVTENRADLRALAMDLAALAKDLRTLSGQARGLLDDASATAKTLRNEVPALSKQASTALTGVVNVSGQLTEEDGKRLKATLARLDAISSKADVVLARIEAGEGSLGAFSKDKQVYDDLKSLLSDLKKHPWKMLWKE